MLASSLPRQSQRLGGRDACCRPSSDSCLQRCLCFVLRQGKLHLSSMYRLPIVNCTLCMERSLLARETLYNDFGIFGDSQVLPGVCIAANCRRVCSSLRLLKRFRSTGPEGLHLAIVRWTGTNEGPNARETWTQGWRKRRRRTRLATSSVA